MMSCRFLSHVSVLQWGPQQLQVSRSEATKTLQHRLTSPQFRKEGCDSFVFYHHIKHRLIMSASFRLRIRLRLI